MGHPVPHSPTVLQMRDYFDEHVKAGRGHCIPMLDQRGLGYIKPDDHGRIALGVPPPNETHDDSTNRVFVRAKY